MHDQMIARYYFMNKRTQENAAFVLLFISITLVLGSMTATPIGGWNKVNDCYNPLYIQLFCIGLLLSFASLFFIWFINRD